MKLKAELLYLILDSCVYPLTENTELRHTNRKATKCFPNRLPDSFKYFSSGKGGKWLDRAVKNSPSGESWTLNKWSPFYYFLKAQSWQQWWEVAKG